MSFLSTKNSITSSAVSPPGDAFFLLASRASCRSASSLRRVAWLSSMTSVSSCDSWRCFPVPSSSSFSYCSSRSFKPLLATSSFVTSVRARSIFRRASRRSCIVCPPLSSDSSVANCTYSNFCRSCRRPLKISSKSVIWRSKLRRRSNFSRECISIRVSRSITWAWVFFSLAWWASSISFFSCSRVWRSFALSRVNCSVRESLTSASSSFSCRRCRSNTTWSSSFSCSNCLAASILALTTWPSVSFSWSCSSSFSLCQCRCFFSCSASLSCHSVCIWLIDTVRSWNAFSWYPSSSVWASCSCLRRLPMRASLLVLDISSSRSQCLRAALSFSVWAAVAASICSKASCCTRSNAFAWTLAVSSSSSSNSRFRASFSLRSSSRIWASRSCCWCAHSDFSLLTLALCSSFTSSRACSALRLTAASSSMSSVLDAAICS
mmetsp:Transcript_24407/g.44135  ORF Transcript_24407/g.44135 Transcript_24407/m.44135 type:complete len:435 (-) Transcript_24407:2533-3837(-)